MKGVPEVIWPSIHVKRRFRLRRRVTRRPHDIKNESCPAADTYINEADIDIHNRVIGMDRESLGQLIATDLMKELPLDVLLKELAAFVSPKADDDEKRRAVWTRAKTAMTPEFVSTDIMDRLASAGSLLVFTTLQKSPTFESYNLTYTKLAIDLAARNGRLDMVKYLMCDRPGLADSVTMLCAGHGGQVEIVEELLEAGVARCDVASLVDRHEWAKKCPSRDAKKFEKILAMLGYVVLDKRAPASDAPADVVTPLKK